MSRDFRRSFPSLVFAQRLCFPFCCGVLFRVLLEFVQRWLCYVPGQFGFTVVGCGFLGNLVVVVVT
jgi:hypothetical protein